jgi:hypothetical protein
MRQSARDEVRGVMPTSSGGAADDWSPLSAEERRTQIKTKLAEACPVAAADAGSEEGARKLDTPALMVRARRDAWRTAAARRVACAEVVWGEMRGTRRRLSRLTRLCPQCHVPYARAGVMPHGADECSAWSCVFGVQLLHELLEFDPSKRPSSEACLRCAYFADRACTEPRAHA